jgi:hypothetical protein
MTPFGIEGSVKNKELTWVYTAALMKALKIDRFNQRSVTITFKNDIGGAEGLCEGDKDYADIQIAKKCPITGRKLGYIEMMKTLAHEMVHARQFLRGQLTCDGGFAWKGRKADGFEYMNQPWEKEAYRLEDELFIKVFPFEASFTQ